MSILLAGATGFIVGVVGVVVVLWAVSSIDATYARELAELDDEPDYSNGR